MRRLAAAVLVVVLLGAACGDDDSATRATTSTTAATTTTAPTTSTTAFADGSTKPTSVPAEGNGVLTDVRVGAEGDLERVVFEFRDTVPGASIEYVEPPITQDASGDEIEVKGDAFLQVVMFSATGYDFDANEEAYTGPDRVTGGTKLVTEVVAAGDFEGYLTWVIGLDREVDYRVLTLDHRLVIELDAG